MAAMFKLGIYSDDWEFPIKVERLPNGELSITMFDKEISDFLPWEEYCAIKEAFEAEEAYDAKQRDIEARAEDRMWDRRWAA